MVGRVEEQEKGGRVRVVLVTMRILVLTEIEETGQQRWEGWEAWGSDAKFGFGHTELEMKERYAQMEKSSNQQEDRGVNLGVIHMDVIVDNL